MDEFLTQFFHKNQLLWYFLTITVFFANVYSGFVNKTLDKSGKYDKIPKKNAYSLIKSGGGIGPMKPGNLRKLRNVSSRGAKSDGNER